MYFTFSQWLELVFFPFAFPLPLLLSALGFGFEFELFEVYRKKEYSYVRPVIFCEFLDLFEM